ncbi:hypothetical protein WJ07_06870 [Burkholderia vietnamiensis]|nr:hypothetical protein WJ07_06870 [Burkholderia vietnamiensis]TPQ43236.1 hypothetical protein C2U71_19040 [Burkholderia ubonensis]
METNHMKPFITDACEGGCCSLPFQFDGITRERIEDALIGKRIVAYALPAGHSLACAWQCRFVLNNGYSLEFSSACTVVTGWHEVGSLNTKYHSMEADEGADIFQEFEIESFRIAVIERLLYEDSQVYSECGLVFHDGFGAEIIVAAGVSPGSVSINAPFSQECFAPEFPVAAYHRASF